MKKRPYRRKNYLIKKGMQLKVAIKVVIVAIFFSLFVGFVLYLAIWPAVSGFLSKDMISLIQQRIFFRAILLFLPFIFVIAASSILLSHRVAGPLYRIELTLDKLIQGEDIDLIRLRKTDELKELAEKINKLIPIIKKSKESQIKQNK